MTMSAESIAGPPVLSTLARSCDETLERLQEVESSTGLICPATLYDDLGRFRVWASNLGAFLGPKNQFSLDYRLRESENMQEAVREKLDVILYWSNTGTVLIRWPPCLQHPAYQFQRTALQILTGERPNRIRPASGVSDATVSAITEMDALASNIHGFINLLFRLSMLIRKQRPRGREIPDSFPRHDPSFDIRHVRDMFPKTENSPWLATRLGKHITESKDIILWRQKHQQDMAGSHKSTDTENDVAEQSASVPDVASGVATTYVTTATEAAAAFEESRAPSVLSGKTSFADAMDVDESGELQVPELGRLTFQGVSLRYDEEFECPFCRTIQVFSTSVQWNRHVFADIQPYVCTFEACTADPFPSRHEWFNHEMEAHRRQWYCRDCPDTTFGTRLALSQHLNTCHTIVASQLDLVLESSYYPIQLFDSSACPLCNKWTPPDSVTDNLRQFCRHVGEHLQKVALAALQQPINGLDIDNFTDVADNPLKITDDVSGSTREIDDSPNTSEPPVKVNDKIPVKVKYIDAGNGLKPGFILVPNWNFKPDGPVSLGNIILDPLRPHLSLLRVDPNLLGDRMSVHVTEKTNVVYKTSSSSTYGVWSKFLNIAGIEADPGLPKATKDRIGEYSIDSLETQMIEIRDDFLARQCSDPKVRNAMRSGRWQTRSVYIVTGIKIARGFKFSETASRTFRGEMGVLSAIDSVGTAVDNTWGVKPSPGIDGGVPPLSWKSGDDIIFAYQLHRVSFKGLKETELEVGLYTPKEEAIF
ncbi:hypothetical protein NLG97_g2188 [Lecanicillium saksenae]|uniref:Uncharacterized protein n=1 Tax=Lecanicillium saksenae TaxID=468837 RepID=A0ACC1R1U8_9HYPO|nr:hypothetical protein NLG97_g2188 [Lecanicillium saksenae]